MIQGMIDAEDMSLKKAIAELVANAIDQDAKEIEVSFDADKRVLTISDDGNGPPEGLEKLVEIGRHVSSKSNPIGRFGWGHKDAVCWLANVVNVYSQTRDGSKQSMFANWRSMMNSKKWDFTFSRDSNRNQSGLTVVLVN
jgi:DNA gyrase/topoisomerase IV subunit B